MNLQQLFRRFFLELIVVAALAGCSVTPPTHPHGDDWCEDCNAGFVAGVRVPSQGFFEALDAHGHTIDPLRLSCTICRNGYDSDGYCTRCRMGFVNQQAYLSRLAYLAARGQAGSLDADESEEVIRETARLEASVARIPQCEDCAMASFFRGRCTQCNKNYSVDRPPR